ncbi:MAG: ParB/RepB/Spo0J family partition protein [Thermoanaerobaculales bacterium]|nr:ParB/RepB/Spo0J family partition protein [Thermoanaerobaculales bacterium]
MSGPTKPKAGLPAHRRMRHDRHFVDELSQRMGEGIGRMVRITAITSNQDQPRAILGDLDDLQSSIDAHGVLEPLLVRPLGDGSYELVSGERRFHAAMAVGLTEVPCIELSVTDQQALEIALIENLQRKDLTAFEEAEGYRTLIDKYRYTHEQVGQAVGRSRVTVSESLQILRIPEPVRGLCRHADISAKGMLLEIARAPDEAAMERLVREIVEHRLDRAALRDRRHELEEPLPAGAPSAGEPAPRKPFRFQFRSSDRSVTVSLAFRTEREPEPRELVEALRQMIAEIEATTTRQNSPLAEGSAQDQEEDQG